MSSLPFKDPSLPVDQRVEDLLARMSLREKIGQLHQLPSREDVRAKLVAQARAGELGSVILAGTAFAGNDANNRINHEALNEIQRHAVEDSRLGIPLIFGRDVIHGHHTVFPIPLGQAASFDPELVRRGARVAAQEARAEGVHWTFSPMVDISRDPRWGRIAESYGEDPFLSSALGVAAVRGFQGDDAPGEGFVLACAKHFVGYGAAEGGRDYNTAEISENTLRNIYLPPFRACCDAGAASIMSGFHDLNGESVSASGFLLTGILREEWGWDGFVVSDWGSVLDVCKHGLAEDHAAAAELGFRAGVDMEMCSGTYSDHLESLLASGRADPARLDASVRRVLRAKFRAGIFERPYIEIGAGARLRRRPEFLREAEEAAAGAFVLLKNEYATLPLARAAKSVVLGGPLLADQRSLLGCWALDGRADETPSIATAWRELAPDTLASVCNPALHDQAHLHFANPAAGAVVLCLGEDQGMSGEHNSVASLDLAPGQVALARAAKQRGKRVVAVVLAGRPLVLTDLEPWCDAILVAWHPGSRGAHAIVRTLFGEFSPAGRLPATFPRHGGQVPIHYNYKPTGKPFGRSLPADGDHRAVLDKYLDQPGQPLYPFGFGLGYTSFVYGEARLVSAPSTLARLQAGEPLVLEVEVTNTGARSGETVAQVYVNDVVAQTTRPVRELKAFRRVKLAPGETRAERFELGPDAFGFHGRDGAWRIEPGEFRFSVGADSTAPHGLSWRLGA